MLLLFSKAKRTMQRRGIALPLVLGIMTVVMILVIVLINTSQQRNLRFKKAKKKTALNYVVNSVINFASYVAVNYYPLFEEAVNQGKTKEFFLKYVFKNDDFKDFMNIYVDRAEALAARGDVYYIKDMTAEILGLGGMVERRDSVGSYDNVKKESVTVRFVVDVVEIKNRKLEYEVVATKEVLLNLVAE